MKHEAEIRRVIGLQAHVCEMQTEVSRILDVIIEKSAPHTGTKFVVDGVLWEVDRWPRKGSPRKEHFSAWCLRNRGPVES